MKEDTGPHPLPFKPFEPPAEGHLWGVAVALGLLSAVLLILAVVLARLQ